MIKEKVKKAVWIEDSIERNNGQDIDIDKLNIEFIKFVESKGTSFCGVFRYHNSIMLDVITDNKSNFDNALLSTNLDYEINIDSADGYCFNTKYDSDNTYGNSKDINELYSNNIFNENILSFEEKGKCNYFQPMKASIDITFKDNKKFMENHAAEIIYNLSKHLNDILIANESHTNDVVGSNFITLELIQEKIDSVLSEKDKSSLILKTNDYKIY